MRSRVLTACAGLALALPLVACHGAIRGDEGADPPAAPDPGDGPARPSAPGGAAGTAGSPGAPPPISAGVGGSGGARTGGSGGMGTGGAPAPGGAPGTGGAPATGGAPGPVAIPPLPEPAPLAAPKPFACDPTKDVPGPRRLWRLTPLQVKNTLHAFWVGRGVLGQWKNAPPKELDLLVPFDGVNNADRFTNFARSFTMSEDELWNVVEAARRVAAQMVSEGRAKGCIGKGAGLGACLRGVAGNAAVLYNRPLATDELDAVARIADESAPTLGEPEAAIVALQSLLASPHYLFRAEGMAGTPAGGLVKLTPYETAAALSFALADMPPDDALWASAGAGTLETAEQLRPHIVRLMGLAQKHGVHPKLRFFREYTYYEGAPAIFKDTKKYPWHRAPMLVDDVDHWLGDLLSRHANGGFFTAFLTSPTAYVRGSYTQTNYDLTGLPQTEARSRHELDPKSRAGILTQPAFLAALSQMEHNDPVKRGKFVRESLLCGTVPPLGGLEVPALPPLGPNATLRDQLRVHSENPACWGCHQFMDPLGLLFETHDHLGRRATKEVGGRPVDGSGYLTGAGPQDGKLAGVVELAHRLAASRVASECFVRHTFEFYLGRSAGAGDGCALSRMHAAFEKDGGDYVGMLTALFASKTFLYRSAP